MEFSTKGWIAVGLVKSLKNKMNAPDTFMLRDDVIVIGKKDAPALTYVYISYSAQNNFGVPLQDIAVYRKTSDENEYLGSYSDVCESAKPLKQSQSDAGYWAAELNRLHCEEAVTFLSEWQLGQRDDFSEVISCKDIAKELGIDYQTDDD